MSTPSSTRRRSGPRTTPTSGSACTCSDPAAAQKQLLGKDAPSAPYVSNIADGFRTAAQLPKEVWVAALKKQLNPSRCRTVNNNWFSFAHHMFAGTMLVHARSQVDAHNKTDLDP